MDKVALAATAVLAFPILGKPLLMTDASEVAIGAILEQMVQEQPRPLAFFSRKLLKGEKRYLTFDHELLSVHQAVRHFRNSLEGITYTNQTNHIPLVHVFTKKVDAWSFR